MVQPPALEAAQQAALKGAVQELPANSGIELANWNWKVVCQYVSERFGISLSRSTCLNYPPSGEHKEKPKSKVRLDLGASNASTQKTDSKVH